MARRPNKKKWEDLSPRARATVIAVGAVQLALKVVAWRDLARRPREQVRGPKAAWFAATLANPGGPILYYVFGRRRTTSVPPTHR
jgi:hypothetical protein